MLPPQRVEHDGAALERAKLAGEERRQRRRACPLDDALLQLDQPQDRQRDRRLVDGDDLVDDAAQNLQRRGADLRDGETVGKGGQHLNRHRLPRGDGGGQAGGVLGLDADQRDAGLERAHRGADSGEQPAATHRHDDRVDVRRLLEDFQRHRALAGHHVGVVERMDEGEALAVGQQRRVRARLGQVRAVQHHAGAELAAVGHLDQRRELRHDDGDRDPQQAAVVRDALRMVAGRDGDDAGPSGRFRQQQQRVAGAAFLEAAGALQVVELAEDMRAGELRQRYRLDAGRLVDAAADALARGEDVVDADHDRRRPVRGSGSARDVAFRTAARGRAAPRAARAGIRP